MNRSAEPPCGPVYGSYWWMVRIQSITEENADIEVKFLHPHGQANVFHWPEHKYIFFVPIATFCVQLMLLILQLEGHTPSLTDIITEYAQD